MKKIKIILPLFFVLFLIPSLASAYWEWTPQTKRWINPKYAVKETAEAQFAWAEEFTARKEYSTAIHKLEQLMQYFPASPLAAKAQFRIGEIYQLNGDWQRAFKAYKKVIDNYPGSDLVTESIGRQFAIGEVRTQKDTGRFSFFRKDPSDMLSQTVDAAPYAAGAVKALYDLGHYQFRRGEYPECLETFDRLTNNYPESEYTEQAEFEAAQAAFKLYRKQENNNVMLTSAGNRLARFLVKYPDGRNRPAAESLDRQVRELLAEKVLAVAEFYAKNKQAKAAGVYYQKVIRDYPDTAAAEKAKKHVPQ